MAVRKAGLGKGLDKMFPVYNDSPAESTDNRKSETKPDAAGKSKQSTSDREGNGEKRRKAEKSSESAIISKSEPGSDVLTVRISRIEPNREQPRQQFRDETLQELAESIREHGVIQPLLVQQKNDRYEIIAGERRWRAAKLAGLKEVPVIVREFTPQETMEISLIENIQREDLNPIEEAQAYRRLMEEYSLKQEDIAGRVSKSRTAVTNTMRLLKLDPRVQELLISQQISAGHARALLAVDDPERQYMIAKRVAAENLNVRDLEKLVKTVPSDKKERRKANRTDSALDMIYSKMEERMKTILGTKVTVNRKTDKKGKIEIEYYSSEELERIYDLLNTINS